MGLNLLHKTELWINGITLSNVNLTHLAHSTAKTLGLDEDKVLVVDVREEHVTLDVLQTDISLESLIGKQELLLKEVGKLPGVLLHEDAHVHSNGILGLICIEGLSVEDAEKAFRRTEEMTREVSSRIMERVLVFPTGFEVARNLIEDTNSPYIKDLLEANGYKVTIGPVASDDIDEMSYRLDDAVSQAFGLIITTGGVGAEDKDVSVESLLRIDSQAATPYIVKFTQGEGRHVKDGVRIGVGQVGPSLIVTLPGPNDEVRLAMGVLLASLKHGLNKQGIADSLALALAQRWAEKTMARHHLHHHHEHQHIDYNKKEKLT